MNSERLSRGLFGLSLAMAVFATGVLAEHFNVFPLPWLKASVTAARQLLEDTGAVQPWYYVRTGDRVKVPTLSEDRMAPGLTLIASTGPDHASQIQVVSPSGDVVHAWRPDWFEIWPDATHVPESARPQSRGGLVHGVLLLPDGSVIFNFTELALVRMDICGNVMWKLPYRTHHSVALDNHGHLWVPGLHVREDRRTDLPNHEPPFHVYRLVQVSLEGRVLQEVRVFEILQRNGLSGLLYLSSTANRETTVTGDTMHLNDIEIFPISMAAGHFSPGDVMISLRNINAVLVFDPDDWSLRYANIGRVIRQHDPDFVDGNTISVFDNNNRMSTAAWETVESDEDIAGSSRIVRFSAVTDEATVVFQGDAEQRMFTDIMGQHQNLSTGGTLITESVNGRVLEVDGNGEIVWEYLNIVDEGLKGLISDAHRLEPEFDEQFFSDRASTCAVPQDRG
jgi:hypothetical protein